MARPPRSADDANKSGPQRLVALVRSSVPPMHPAGLPFVSAGSGFLNRDDVSQDAFRFLKIAQCTVDLCQVVHCFQGQRVFGSQQTLTSVKGG